MSVMLSRLLCAETFTCQVSLMQAVVCTENDHGANAINSASVLGALRSGGEAIISHLTWLRYVLTISEKEVIRIIRCISHVTRLNLHMFEYVCIGYVYSHPEIIRPATLRAEKTIIALLPLLRLPFTYKVTLRG